MTVVSHPATNISARADRVTRVVVGVALIAASALIAIRNESFRAWEAAVATFFLTPLNDHQLGASMDRLFVWVGPETLIALRVTVECTALIIGVPLSIVAALLLVTNKTPWMRTFLALGAMWAIVIVVNTARLTLIGWSTMTWGISPGYRVSHTFTGSLLGILGYAAGLAVLLLIMGVRPHPRRIVRRGDRRRLMT